MTTNNYQTTGGVQPGDKQIVVGTSSGALAVAVRWLRVSAYGAVGDGVTDDTANLTAAINATSPGGYGLYWEPNKTYMTSSTLTPKAGTIWKGHYGTTIIKSTPGVLAFHIVSTGNISNFVIEDMVVDGNKANTTQNGVNGNGLYFSASSGGVTGLIARRVIAQNVWAWGIRGLGKSSVSDPETLPQAEMYFEDCYGTNCGINGMSVDYTTDSFIIGLRATLNAQGGLETSINRNLTVMYPCTNNNTGHGQTHAYNRGMRLIGPVARTNTNSGVVLGGGSAGNPVNLDWVVSDFVVQGNSQQGLTVDPTISGQLNALQEQRGTIQGGVAEGNGGHGVYLNHVSSIAVSGVESSYNGNAGFLVTGQRIAWGTNHSHHNTNGGITLASTASIVGAGQQTFAPQLLHDNGTDFSVDQYHTDISYAESGRVYVNSASGLAVTIPTPVVYSQADITLTANCTLTFPFAFTSARLTIVLRQDATGSRTVTWPGTVKWAGGAAPVLTMTASKADAFSFRCTDGTNWLGSVVGQNY